MSSVGATVGPAKDPEMRRPCLTGATVPHVVFRIGVACKEVCHLLVEFNAYGFMCRRSEQILDLGGVIDHVEEFVRFVRRTTAYQLPLRRLYYPSRLIFHKNNFAPPIQFTASHGFAVAATWQYCICWHFALKAKVLKERRE